jgi:RimJ/RimL family protein N-acetyltransferase
MKNKDQILLESIYERILLKENSFPSSKEFEEYPSPTEKEIKDKKLPDVSYNLEYVEDEDYEGNDESYYALYISDPKTGKSIGQTIFKKDEDNDRFIINNITIAPEHRNKGYGQVMYRLIAKYGQKIGISKIYSDTLTPSAINARKKVFNLKMNKFGEQGLKAESDIDKNVTYTGYPTPRP